MNLTEIQRIRVQLARGANVTGERGAYSYQDSRTMAQLLVQLIDALVDEAKKEAA